MDFENTEDFLGRWADGRLSEEEQRAFESSDDFKTYQKILAGSSDFSVSQFDDKRALSATKEKLQSGSKSVGRSLVPVWSVAAAVLVLVVSYFVLTTSSNVVTTKVGELAEEVLPDGSKVTINTKTEVKYRRRKWEDNRKISLSGEAYFEVAKGSTFTVVSPLGDVQVLGTKFNVYAREGILEVKCFEGKVKVAGVEEMILAAGESYRQINGEIEPGSEDESDLPAWMNSESVFNNSPVSIVLLELSNQYGLKFEGNIPDDETKITVSFPNNDEGLAADLVFKSLQKSYQKKSEKVIVID